MKKTIYLDNHATTPLDPRVLDAMLPYLREEFGNPSSNTHAFGWRAKAAVEKARASVAALVGANPDEVIFTSGATESNNWAIVGSLNHGDHAVSTAFEHKSVLACLDALRTQEIASTIVSIQCDGQVAIEDLARAITPRTKLITVMMANNEIGSILPVAAFGKIAKEKGVLFHCDAVQAAGKIRIDVNEMQVDFLSLSAHKVYGPKGVGAMYVRREKKNALRPLIYGGGQECGMRGGTLNVAGIVGFGAAAEIARAELAQESQRVTSLRERLWAKLQALTPAVRLNGALENRLCGNLNVSFEGVDGEMMLLSLQNQIAISASSACSSAVHKGSHVLTAIGVSPEVSATSFRIGIGRFNTESDIDAAAEALADGQSNARI